MGRRGLKVTFSLNPIICFPPLLFKRSSVYSTLGIKLKIILLDAESRQNTHDCGSNESPSNIGSVTISNNYSTTLRGTLAEQRRIQQFP